MKFSANHIVALLAFVVPSTNASGLILRAIDASGDGTFPQCAMDAGLIGTELNAIFEAAADEEIGGGGRGLRGRELQTSQCRILCKGFYPGTCVWAYPWCVGQRARGLEEEQPIVNGVELLVEENTLECASLYLDVHAKLVQLAGQVDDACAAELLAPAENKCFRIVHN